MEISKNALDARLRKMRRQADLMGEDQGVAFRRLMESIIDILGAELAGLREEVGVLERKLDTHVSTLRTDVSHLRQALPKKGEASA